MIVLMKLVKGYRSWLKMGKTYLEVLGCLGEALVILLGGEIDFRTVDAFEIGLETGFSFVLVNLKGTGGCRGTERTD